MIITGGLGVTIGQKTIIADIGIEAPAGAVTAIVGPNGSGKSTLFGAISGTLAYSGSARINGHEVARLSPAQASTMRAVLPQAMALAFPFTVREVVQLGISDAEKPRDRAGRVDEALRRVDLTGFAGRYYQELSGGEQQRVQLARVLCQVWEPKVGGQPCSLLLDEPVSSLDIRHQLAIMEVAREFAEAGGCVLVILHDLNLTAMYADLVHVLSRGQLAASGTPSEVLTDELLERVFGCRLKVGSVPPPHVPFVLPQSVRP